MRAILIGIIIGVAIAPPVFVIFTYTNTTDGSALAKVVVGFRESAWYMLISYSAMLAIAIPMLIIERKSMKEE